MCRVLHISEQGYYRFLRRPERGQRARQLLEQIYDCLREDEENGENYRVRRIISWLRLHRGYTGGFWRIYRICQEHHLIIRRQRRFNSLTKADRQAEKSENLINRDFTAAKPNQKFLTDITEIPCTDGKLYLAVLDCFDGSIQGFHMDDNMCAELCVRALENTCRNTRMEGAILHSDWGSRFTSQLFRQALRRCKLVQSMSGTGRCYDNARMESVFATLKKEKLYIMDTTKLPREDVKSLVFRYIHYYNLRRISSVNGGLPPLVLRRQFFCCNFPPCRITCFCCRGVKSLHFRTKPFLKTSLVNCQNGRLRALLKFYCLSFVSIIEIPNMCKTLMNRQNRKIRN